METQSDTKRARRRLVLLTYFGVCVCQQGTKRARDAEAESETSLAKRPKTAAPPAAAAAAGAEAKSGGSSSSSSVSLTGAMAGLGLVSDGKEAKAPLVEKKKDKAGQSSRQLLLLKLMPIKVCT